MSLPLKLAALGAAAFGALLFTTGAQAAGCGKPRNAFDNVYCLGNEFAKADKELNEAYGVLQRSLPANRMAEVKHDQLAWIRDRDDKCSYSRGSSDFVDLDCAVTMTEDRAQILQRLAHAAR